MMNDISVVAAEKICAGCGACAVICPKNAIALKENTAGFYEAVIDGESCAHCGQCAEICPRLSDKEGRSLRQSKLFALQSTRQEIVKSCSSGGIAHELAEVFLENGDGVVGAAYDLNTDRVLHLLVDGVDELWRLDGSKYLQSDVTEAFSNAVCKAKTNKEARFLVIGTPCQIAGAAAMTEKLGIRDQFLLAEIFCHGVPSYRVWDETVKKASEKLGAGQFESVRFRYKRDDWHSYCLRIDANDKSYYGKRETELFWQVFFENVLLNDACLKCAARKDSSCADLRLGDYWGSRFMERTDGVSAVFAITKRGEAAVEQLLQTGRVRPFEQGTPDEMLAAQNMEGYKQMELHERAMELLRSGADVRAVVRQYRKGFSAKQKLKIALLKTSAVLPDGIRAKARKTAHRARKS